ncbi:MAG TPA: CRTAC1 family protein [Candidatus Limnocylindria bacterium]|nr:CRTAC1 family protein [Candidatus Limnocylindria bacterium]
MSAPIGPDSRRRWLFLVPVVALVAGVVGWTTLKGLGPRVGNVDAPRFVDEAASAGIEHAYTGDFEHVVGGGVAAFDCSGDGLPDLYLAGGASPAALYRNESRIGGTLAFERVASPTTDLTRVTGAYPLDLDGDGVTDLAVLRVGENVLLRGTGDCEFERANEVLGFEGGDAWSTAFSATWEDDAQLPTLAIGNYIDLDTDVADAFRCDDGELVRPKAGGAYYEQPITLTGFCSLSMLFSDWDRSGRRDLRVSNDRQYYGADPDGQEQLWRMEPGRAPVEYTLDDGWQPLRIWGMGIASMDLTADGFPEVFLTSQADNKLQTLADGPERPTYRDIALSRGVTATRPYAGDTTLPSTAWHPEFQDVNNDGLVDLFVSKGNVEAQTGFAARDPSNLFLGQPDGTFAEAAEAAGIVSFARARGASIIDLNLDGLLDLVVVNRYENVLLWRNVGAGSAADPRPMGHWIGFRLVEPGSNRDAIGAWIEIRAGDRTITRELTVGGGHASGSLGWIQVGIGSADEASVTVTWPDGVTDDPVTVPADSRAVIDRGTGRAEPWRPGS